MVLTSHLYNRQGYPNQYKNKPIKAYNIIDGSVNADIILLLCNEYCLPPWEFIDFLSDKGFWFTYLMRADVACGTCLLYIMKVLIRIIKQM